MKMKSFKLFALILALGLFTFLGTATANAQQILRFDIPFEFYVGNEKLSAGTYELKKVSSSAFLLRNAAEDRKTLISVKIEDAVNQDIEFEKVIFNRYDEAYFLRKIYPKRMSAGGDLGESKLEKKIRRQENNLAKDHTKTKQISVTATK